MTRDKQPTAVVIDDDAASAWGLALLLHDHGFHTISGRDCDSVQQRLHEEGLTPDVVVCDFHLDTEENDVVAATRLQDHFDQDIPAVIVTGSSGPASHRLASSQGFPVVSKPVDPDLLMHEIHQISSGVCHAGPC